MNGRLEAAPVVVGVDGSEAARHALLWAARTARRLDRPLHIVHAWLWPAIPRAHGFIPGAPTVGDCRARGESVLERARFEAATIAGESLVGTDLVYGEASAVLVGRSDDAEMVVTGARGSGGFAGLTLGSVSPHVASRARCAAVVVRGNEEPNGPVVVGVDGSEPSESALVSGLETARSLGARLVVMTSWDYPFFDASQPAGGYHDALEQQARATLDTTVCTWLDKYPDVEVERQVIQGAAAYALTDASLHARLIIVGSHGTGALRRLVLGSVSHALIHHAHCPVMILPPGHRANVHSKELAHRRALQEVSR